MIKNKINQLNEDYGSLIKRKKEYFAENIFPNYSEKEKIIVKEKYWPEQFRYIIYFFSNLLTLIYLGFMPNLATTQFVLVTILLLLSKHPSFKKFLLKKWMKEKENYDLLLDATFLESPVDNEVLKFFVKKYGKEDFINIMRSKEFVTYKDIKEYTNNISKLKETNRISEIADSLLV